MKYYKCWDNQDIEKYFTTESREKNKDAFIKTHVPINRIAVEFSKDASINKPFISENELKELIINSKPEEFNKIYLIVGETGSGKSELCQWIDYNIDDEIHVPIHISRSDTRIGTIIETLNKNLPFDQHNSEIKSELLDVDPEIIARLLIAEISLLISINKPKEHNLIYKIVNEQYFKIKLIKDIEEYQLSVSNDSSIISKERRINILSKSTFDNYPDVKFLKDKDNAYRLLNQIITNTLKRYLGVTNVGEELRKISDHYLSLGKRPVLILEDLTSFSFIAEDLIDYIFDLSKGHFDVLIGWTTGFEASQRDYIFKGPDSQTYMRDRIRARFLMTSQNRDAFFLEDNYILLAQKYLSAIKCDKCELCKNDKTRLYPFNEEILQKIYNNLQEGGNSKKTPRIFLEYVIRRILQSAVPPWITLNNISDNVKNVPSLISQEYKEYPDFIELTRWYGTEEKDFVVLPDYILNWFDISVPFKMDGNFIRVPKSGFGKFVNKPVESTGLNPLPTIEIEEAVDFENWVRNGGKFTERELLRKGMLLLLPKIMDPCEINNRITKIRRNSSLFYKRGSDSIPIYIEESGDDSADKEFKLQITRKTPLEILQGFFVLGRVGKISDIGEELLVSLIEWGNRSCLEYNSNLKKQLEETIGLSIEKFSLFSMFLLTNLSMGYSNIDIEGIKKPIEENNILEDTDIDDSSSELLFKKYEIESLFESFFSITNSFFDYDYFTSVFDQTDTDKIIKKIINVDSRKIREAYRIGTKQENISFRELFTTVKDYCSELIEWRYTKDLNLSVNQLSQIYTLSPDRIILSDIEEKINQLKKCCSNLDIVLNDQWIESFNLIIKKEYDWDNFKNILYNVLNNDTCNNSFEYISYLDKYKYICDMDEFKIINNLGQLLILIEANLSINEKSIKSEELNLEMKMVKNVNDKIIELCK